MSRDHQTGGDNAFHSTVTSKRIHYIIDSTRRRRITDKRSSLRNTNVGEGNRTAIIGIVHENSQIASSYEYRDVLSLLL